MLFTNIITNNGLNIEWSQIIIKSETKLFKNCIIKKFNI